MKSSDSIVSEASRFLEVLWADLGAKARLQRAKPGEAPDLWCVLDLDGRRVRLGVEVKARYVASEIEKAPTLKRADALLVIPHLGQGARNRLRASGVNHADFSGYVYLNAPRSRARGAPAPSFAVDECARDQSVLKEGSVSSRAAEQAWGPTASTSHCRQSSLPERVQRWPRWRFARASKGFGLRDGGCCDVDGLLQ